MLSFVYDIHTDVVYWFVPDEWTKAVIVPVHKKGESGDVANYRPISLTYVACKLMERVIAKIYMYICLITIYCLMHNMVSSVVIQHAPICWSAINDWTLSIQDNKSVIVAYIDFSRAFDTVSHKKLLAKLYTYMAFVMTSC